MVLKISIVLFALLLLLYPIWWAQEERRVDGKGVRLKVHRAGTTLTIVLLGILLVLFTVVVITHTDSFSMEGKSDLRSGTFGIIAVMVLIYIFTLIYNRYYLKVYRFSRAMVWMVILSMYGLTVNEFISTF